MESAAALSIATGKKLIVKALRHQFCDIMTVMTIHGPKDILSAEIEESRWASKITFNTSSTMPHGTSRQL